MKFLLFSTLLLFYHCWIFAQEIPNSSKFELEKPYRLEYVCIADSIFELFYDSLTLVVEEDIYNTLRKTSPETQCSYPQYKIDSIILSITLEKDKIILLKSSDESSEIGSNLFHRDEKRIRHLKFLGNVIENYRIPYEKIVLIDLKLNLVYDGDRFIKAHYQLDHDNQRFKIINRKVVL